MKVLKVGTLIDGTGRAPISDAAIVVEGSTIRSVGPAAALGPEAHDAEVLDFSSAFAMPGLVDAHSHLTLAGDCRTYEEMALDPNEVLAVTAVRNARIHLESGVTTLRDNGGRDSVTFAVREAMERGYFVGPRMLLSGRPVTVTRGHFFWCHEEADDVSDIRRSIRRLVSEGADFIKIMATGGGTAHTEPARASYSVEELRAAVELSHDLGRLITAHCRGKQGMERATEARVDGMEHGEFLLPDGTHRYDERLAARMIEAGIYLGPTMQASRYHTQVALQCKQEREGLTPAEASDLAAISSRTNEKLEIFHHLLEAGMGDHLLPSTDAGCFDMDFGKMYYSLDLFVKGGMTPMQALVAGTSQSARAIGVGHLTGSLEPGKEADILLLNADPLVDVTNVRHVAAVFKGGERVIPWTR